GTGRGAAAGRGGGAGGGVGAGGGGVAPADRGGWEEGPPASPGALARAAGALATSGDARLVQVAVALQPPGLGLPLGNGDVLALEVPANGEEEGDASGGGGGEAAFVLHSAELGP